MAKKQDYEVSIFRAAQIVSDKMELVSFLLNTVETLNDHKDDLPEKTLREYIGKMAATVKDIRS